MANQLPVVRDHSSLLNEPLSKAAKHGLRASPQRRNLVGGKSVVLIIRLLDFH
ncbi:MAG: hypothetical protein ACRENX_02355 [Candidatus Dormibacteria bacterium]